MTYVNMAEYEKNSSYFNAYTTSEILFPYSHAGLAQSNCLTIDPTSTHISRATNTYRVHDYQNQLCFEEGDYKLDLTYDWRMSSSAIINHYADTGNNVHIDFIKNLTAEFQTGASGGYGHNIDADGTFTALSTLHSSEIALSSSVLRLEKRVLFRVEDNPVVLKWNFNWGSYYTYVRGMTYNLSVNKYPLGTLRN